MSIIGIGQDMIEIERIRQALRRHGERFERRCYSPAEIQYCQRFKDPTPEFAARFAAKEAAAKALGTGIARGVFWRDFETLRRPGSAPTLTLHGGALEHARRLRVDRVHVTLTHSRNLACAVVILEKLTA
jgi:holo-[acyl-carrier protein] synthase